jgi:uncharacterized membrane protein
MSRSAEPGREWTGVLVAIFAAAIAVRLYSVLVFPFEQDEIYTVHESRDLFDTTIRPGIQARPLFFFLLHPIVNAFPHSAAVLRTLPFIFGIAGVLATWALAKSLLGRSGAMLATLFIAASAWHISTSSFARYYSLVYLLATIVYLFFPRAVDRDQPRDYLVVLAAMLAGGFTHPSFVFPVAAASLAVMAFRADGSLAWKWPTRNGWTYLWIPFSVSFVALFLVIRMVDDTASVDNGSWRGLLASLRLIPAIVDLIGPAICVACLCGIFALSRGTPARDHLAGVARRRFASMAAAGIGAGGVGVFARGG